MEAFLAAFSLSIEALWYVFFAVILFYAIYSAILLYHWVRYSMSASGSLIATFVYFGVSLPLIFTLLIATVNLTAV